MKSQAAENLAFVIGAAGISANDIVSRSDYKTEAEYLVALGQTEAALNDPKIRSGLVKAQADKIKREREAERRAETERIRERARTLELTDEQRDAITSKATEQAAREYAHGDLDPRKTLAQRQRELAADIEKQERKRIAGNEAANAAIRAAWRNPTEADRAFVDRVVNRPTLDE